MNLLGRAIARFLEKPIRGYEPAVSPDFSALTSVLRPGDVVLVEGNIRVSSAPHRPGTEGPSLARFWRSSHG